MANSGRSGCAGLLTEAGKSISNTARGSKPEPRCPGLRASRVRPRCTKSKANRIAPKQAKLCGDSTKSSGTRSSMGEGRPNCFLPKIGNAEPTQAKFCRNAKDPMLKGSSTKTGGSKHVDDCKGSKKPIFTQSGAGSVGSNRTHPTADIASWRNPLGNFTSPKADEESPIRHQACRGSNRPRCKRSIIKGATPIFAELWISMARPVWMRSRIGGDEPNCALPEATRKDPGQAKLWGNVEASTWAGSETSRRRPKHDLPTMSIRKSNRWSACADGKGPGWRGSRTSMEAPR